MEKICKQAVGIDMAKDKFDVCFSVIDAGQKVTVKSTRKFANTKSGFRELDSWHKKLAKDGAGLAFVVEATGVYYENLAWHLHAQGAHISVVLPNKARKYAQSLGLKSKNDSIDAKGLARMACEQALEKWQPMSDDFYKIRALTRELEDIHASRTALNNRLHALGHAHTESKGTMKRIAQQVALLDKQIKAIEKEVRAIVEGNAEIKDKMDKITKVKGLGLMSAVTVVAECGGFGLIKNQRQLVSYAGYDVVENQSGKKSGRTRISKKGNGHIRRILFMPAFNVVRFGEPRFVAFFERLVAKGKARMQAYVAVQKKLLCLIYALWKSGGVYVGGGQKTTSGEGEAKPLFPVACTANPKKIVAPIEGATQDGHPFEVSTEALFPVGQS